MEKETNIVIVLSPAFSHLLSLIELSKRIIQLSNALHITFLIPTLNSPPESSKSILQTLPSTIHATFLPPIHIDDLPEGTPIAAHLQLTVTCSLPFIRDALKSLSLNSNLATLVADLFASDSLICAKELNILSLIYCPSSATTLSFCLFLPKLDQIVVPTTQFKDLHEPIQIPGCVPINGRDLLNPVQDRNSIVYELFLQKCKNLLHINGIIVNSFKEIEQGPIKALIDETNGYPKVYPIGPIIQTDSTNPKNGSECLTWLNNQLPNSVLYVSFGSGGTLSQDQINELAFGLELSGKKFLWVVRAPNESSNFGYLNSQKNDDHDPLKFLPYGFIDRTKEQSFLVSYWAPQVQILSHNAIGGFLSHCGSNSILESIMNGIPIIAWPLFAEQKMNAVLLNDGIRVAIRPKGNENGIVEKEEIGEVVTRVIEGDDGREIRERMKKRRIRLMKRFKKGCR
ncbi:hydroquinone glucosyltransferase [Trifolium repens]|nr:hydroquinone glucosyltransferase [Trifolium repens]